MLYNDADRISRELDALEATFGTLDLPTIFEAIGRKEVLSSTLSLNVEHLLIEKSKKEAELVSK
jgi:hypothetical protein